MVWDGQLGRSLATKEIELDFLQFIMYAVCMQFHVIGNEKNHNNIEEHHYLKIFANIFLFADILSVNNCILLRNALRT